MRKNLASKFEGIFGGMPDRASSDLLVLGEGYGVSVMAWLAVEVGTHSKLISEMLPQGYRRE